MMAIIAHPTDPNLRIRTERDDAPAKPYDDGGFPIWRIEHGNYGGRAVQETDITSYVTPGALDHGITGMLERDESADKDLLARYLRIFWGVTFTAWWHSGNYWYVTCDPADWRQEVGVTDDITAREDYAANPFEEFESWVKGNVHVATAEHRIFVRSQHETWDLRVEHPELAEGQYDTSEAYEWLTDETVGGFYGDVDQSMAANMAWNFGWEIPEGHTFEIEED